MEFIDCWGGKGIGRGDEEGEEEKEVEGDNLLEG